MAASTILRRRKVTGWIERLSFNHLLLASSISLILSLGQRFVNSGSISAWGLLVFSCWVVVALAYFYSCSFKANWQISIERWGRKYGFYPVVWLITVLVWFFDILALPSLAQTGGGGFTEGFFFNNLREQVSNILSTNENAAGAVDIINFGFGILQLAMLLYLAFAIYQAVKAHQQDQDWFQVAKVPLIILFAVTAGDFAIGLIAG